MPLVSPVAHASGSRSCCALAQGTGPGPSKMYLPLVPPAARASEFRCCRALSQGTGPGPCRMDMPLVPLPRSMCLGAPLRSVGYQRYEEREPPVHPADDTRKCTHRSRCKTRCPSCWCAQAWGRSSGQAKRVSGLRGAHSKPTSPWRSLCASGEAKRILGLRRSHPEPAAPWRSLRASGEAKRGPGAWQIAPGADVAVAVASGFGRGEAVSRTSLGTIS